MVIKIAQTVASEDLRLEEALTIAGLNTHQKGVLPIARNAIIARRRDITPNAAIQS